MQIHLYDDSDIRQGQSYEFGGVEYPYAFIADVPGDNPDTLGDYDNNKLADRLEAADSKVSGAIVDPETCCFYAYFKTMKGAKEFVQKLNQYIMKKSELLRKAVAF
jgi:hypothetical protein